MIISIIIANPMIFIAVLLLIFYLNTPGLIGVAGVLLSAIKKPHFRRGNGACQSNKKAHSKVRMGLVKIRLLTYSSSATGCHLAFAN
jgi:hypothetical protein